MTTFAAYGQDSGLKVQQLTPLLRRLGLSGVLESLEVRHHQAIQEQHSYVDFLARLLQDEIERRAQKKLAVRLQKADLGSQKTVETFDFHFNPTVNRQQVYDLATCQFIERKENVLLVGPTGVGKTHLAHALAHEACRRGYDVVSVGASQMLTHLHGGRADESYAQRLLGYTKPPLLVIDDFGLKPLRPPGPEDLYEVIAARYERGSLIVTSNRDFSEWLEAFGDPLLGSAALDRLVHNAHRLVITGESYRSRSRPFLTTDSGTTGRKPDTGEASGG